MAFEVEQREALSLLQGIENGTLQGSAAALRLQDADPALVYFLFTWLRSHYRNHPAAEGVLGRVVALTQGYPEIAALLKEGKSDAIVTWFEEQHSYREFDAQAFVALIIEKLEG